jgi:hypothetical protein
VKRREEIGIVVICGYEDSKRLRTCYLHACLAKTGVVIGLHDPEKLVKCMITNEIAFLWLKVEVKLHGQIMATRRGNRSYAYSVLRDVTFNMSR